MESQNKTILNHLKKHGYITAYLAVRLYGIFRLSGRIYDLKKQGFNIASKLEFNKSKHWARYFLSN
jgi:predicted fused transcriptional regulator/phosphomethylpyrimidine kinase